jgi:hypothetical protein
MKHFVGVGTLVALALIVRLWAFQSIGLDIHLHDTYRVIPLRVVGFWALIGIAAAWFLIAAYKFRRHSSGTSSLPLQLNVHSSYNQDVA